MDTGTEPGGDCIILEKSPICSSLFELLLNSDGRTTDMLEAIVGEVLNVSVLKQDELTECGNLSIYRESALTNPSTGLIVSQNYCRIDASFTPEDLLQTILGRTSGIGSKMKSLEVCTLRKIVGKGWVSKDNIGNFHSRPIHLLFQSSEMRVPFKKYTIQFSPYQDPGIYMLEYFNPLMIERFYIPGDSKIMNLAY